MGHLMKRYVWFNVAGGKNIREYNIFNSETLGKLSDTICASIVSLEKQKCNKKQS